MKLELKLLEYYNYYFREAYSEQPYNEFKSLLLYDVAQFIYAEMHKCIQSQCSPEEKERMVRNHIEWELNYARATHVKEYIEFLEHLKNAVLPLGCENVSLNQDKGCD